MDSVLKLLSDLRDHKITATWNTDQCRVDFLGDASPEGPPYAIPQRLKKEILHLANELRQYLHDQYYANLSASPGPLQLPSLSNGDTAK